MVTDVDIVNYALTLLGEKRIASLSEDSKPAREANAIYALTRDGLLSNYNWNFAMARGKAYQQPTAPLFGFKHAWRFPDDALRLVLVKERYAGVDLTSYRDTPTEEYCVEGNEILTDWSEDGTDAITVGGAITAIIVDDPGLGYVSVPGVSIPPPIIGVQAAATAYMGCLGDLPGAGASLSLLNVWHTGTDYAIAGGVFLPFFQAYVRSISAGNPGPHALYKIVPVIPIGQRAAGAYSVMPGVPSLTSAIYFMNNAAGLLAQPEALPYWFIWGVSLILVTNGGSGYSAAAPPVITLTGGNDGFTAPQHDPGTDEDGKIATAHAVVSNATQGGPYLNVRYVKQVTDPAVFDNSFVSSLGCLLAADLAETLTQSAKKRELAIGRYKDEIKNAVRTNAIQLPPKRLRDDDWMFSRL